MDFRFSESFEAFYSPSLLLIFDSFTIGLLFDSTVDPTLGLLKSSLIFIDVVFLVGSR